MEKQAWMASQLSIARHFGGIKICGTEYLVVRNGSDDLIRKDFAKLYGDLGRSKFIELLKAHPDATDEALKGIMQDAVLYEKNKKKAPEAKEMTLDF